MAGELRSPAVLTGRPVVAAGRVVGTDPVGTGRTLVRTTSTSAEVVRYAIDLRWTTRGGQGSFARRFSHYEELPPHLAAREGHRGGAKSRKVAG